MTPSNAQTGTVYLVGAGPGDPELLTVRALRLLQTADLVLHDDLVPPEVLALAGSSAEVVSVGKRYGEPRITQSGLNDLMIAAARAGRCVVRLKSGDPLIFGRAGEEIAALQQAGVPLEIVPGVTAAVAAGAALRMPLTDRSSASKLILLTGHQAAGKSAAHPLWAGEFPRDASVVVYMPGRDLGQLAKELTAAGLAGDVPCVAVSQIATARQSAQTCRLSELGELRAGPAPLLVVVGPAVEGLLQPPLTTDPAV